jgi:phage shock protein A
MSIFKRILTVIKSNINDLINKAEDPKKMLDQLISDMNSQLVQVKQEVASAIADEKRLQREYEKARKEANKWGEKAELAVKKGEDNLAMQALQRQESAESEAAGYEKQWVAQREAVDKLKAALTQLNNKLQEANRKKNLLIARQKRAEATQKINKTMASLSDTSAFDTFARMEEKINQLEARTEAEEEINESLEGSSLEEEFKELESSSNLKDKLAALKAKVEQKQIESGEDASTEEEKDKTEE